VYKIRVKGLLTQKCEKMKVLYTRISTFEQKSVRQTQNSKDYDCILEDTSSGATPFFEREKGKLIEKMVNKGQVTSLFVHQIDRLGRNLMDILKTISYFNKKGICVHFIQQGIKTLNEDGTENQISKMIISILGVVAEMERNLIKERQLEGIAIAKANGVYKGRKVGTSTSTLDFLNKPKNKKAIEFLKIDKLKKSEVAKITGLHINTITKINKALNKLESN
jgi:DNA invertase Pin-like site-specific DNA recombinase